MSILFEVARYMVGVATDANSAICDMLVFVKFGMEQALGMLSRHICGKPAFIVAMCNGLSINSGTDQPVSDGFDCVVGRRKQLVNFLGGEMLAVLLRLRM